MRNCRVEIDKVRGTKFPPNQVTHRGNTQDLGKIYRKSGITLDIAKGQANLEPINSKGTFNLAQLHQYMVSHREPDRPDWHAHVLVVPFIRYHRNGRTHMPLGTMYDLRSFDLNQTPREGCALSWKKLRVDDRVYLRTLAHELGHIFNLEHPDEIGDNLMNTTEDLRSLGNFPNNIRYQFNDRQSRWLAQGPAFDVRPGGSPFGSNPNDEDNLYLPRFPISTNLSLFASTQADSYIMGEPVHLRLGLRCLGGEPFQLNADLSAAGGHITVFIRDTFGIRRRFRPCVLACSEARQVILQPGDELLDSIPIAYGTDGLSFTRPGIYKVHAVYRAPTENGVVRIVSNSPSIEIRSPRSRREKDISDRLTLPDRSLFLVLGGGRGRAGKDLGDLAKSYGNAPELQSVKLEVARDLVDRSAGKGDMAKAKSLMDTIKTAPLSHEQTADLKGLQVIVNRGLSNNKEANLAHGRMKTKLKRCHGKHMEAELENFEKLIRDKLAE